MKSLIYPSATAAVLLAAACQHVDAFAPPVPRASTTITSKAIVPNALLMPPLQMAQGTDDDDDEKQLSNNKQQSFNPTPAVFSMMNNWLGSEEDKKKANGMKFAAAAMAFALAFMPISDAEAAMSGGRMGGSFSAPRQTMSRPSYSRSSSYSSYRAPSISVSPGYGYGYGVSPFMSPISPFSPFSPFGAPRVYGGPGVISVARGPSFFDLVFFGGFLWVASQVLLNVGRGPSASAGLDWTSQASSALGSGTNVAQLSVALEVPNRDDRNSILSVLDRLSNTARTDSRMGVQNLTSQVALELLRRRSSIVSASSSSRHFGDRTKALREFQSRALKERSKFENENTSRFGGVDYGSKTAQSAATAGSGSATMVVVTLVVAIDGDSTKLPNINSLKDLESALQTIATNSKVDDCLQGAEILWTPEDRSESLSLRDVVADYPDLRAV